MLPYSLQSLFVELRDQQITLYPFFFTFSPRAWVKDLDRYISLPPLPPPSYIKDVLGVLIWALHSLDSRAQHRDLYIHSSTATSFAEQFVFVIVKVVQFQDWAWAKGKRVTKNSGNRNIEESDRFIFSSSIGGRNLLAFPRCLLFLSILGTPSSFFQLSQVPSMKKKIYKRKWAKDNLMVQLAICPCDVGC